MMYPAALLMRAKFGVLQQTQGLHLHAKFHLNLFIVSAFGDQNVNYGQILTLGESCTDPTFTNEGQIGCAGADPWCTLTCQIMCWSVYSVAPWWQKTTHFPAFWNSALLGVGSWQQLKKWIMGAQPQTFPYPTISKSFLYSNAFMAKSGVQSLTFESMMNRQISTFLAVPAAGKILYLENLWGSGA